MVTQVDNDQLNSYLKLITFNESIYCEQPPDQPGNNLLSFYKAIGLLLGPINAILNGICVHIFKHPIWKKSAMSRILKGLSIIELCMGISLFLYALLYAQNSNSGRVPSTLSDQMKLNFSQQIVNTTAFDQSNRNRALMFTITSFLLMMVFSRCLVAFQVARNWSVVLLAAYRYDCICRPIGTGTALPRERIRIFLIAVVLLSFVAVLPRVFELGIIVCDVNGLYAGDNVLLLRDPFYQIAYLGVVMFIVQSGGPIICVCVLSAFVIRIIAKRRKIHKINEQKSARRMLSIQNNARTRPSESELNTGIKATSNENMNDSSPSTANTNLLALTAPVDRPSPTGDKLMFAVCITFFILETPAFFSKILNPYLEQHHPELDLCLSVIANVLVYLDSTMNAFVYMASNPTFRKVAHDECIKYRGRLTGTLQHPTTNSNRAASGGMHDTTCIRETRTTNNTTVDSYS